MTASYDIKREFTDLYAPKAGRIELVEVPEFGFLMVEGRGDPNTSPDYAAAVEALFLASYAARGVARELIGRVHTVGPLEGLWTADDLSTFTTRDKTAWRWTMLIVQPGWITSDLASEALSRARASKGSAALTRVRFQKVTEGLCVQALHVGPYDDEGPLIDRMHHDFLPAHDLVPTGPHHEIYLSDARRCDPSKLRTIVRQPVAHRPRLTV